MRPISQTGYLSRNYSALQGLNAVPLGLALILACLWANLVHYPVQSVLLPVSMVSVCLLLSFLVDRYYKRTYGQVKPVSLHRRRTLILQVGAGLLALLAFWVDVTFRLPVNLIGLLFAAMFLFDKPTVKFPLNRFTAVRFVAAILMILASLAPLGWWHALGVRTTIIGVVMLAGLLMALQGILWHIFFVRSLPAVEVGDE